MTIKFKGKFEGRNRCIEDDGVVQSADQEIGVPGGSAQSQEWLATIRFHS